MVKTAEIGGLNICYEETGNPNGTPVVLLHGWGCDHTTVRSVAAVLESAMHVFSIDLPGHGKTDEPPTVWGSDDFADLIIDFIKLNNLSDPVLIGHSFGGRTSIAVASKRPVSKMVLIDAAGITPKRSLRYYYKVYSFKLMKKFAKLFLGAKRGEKFVEKQRQKRGSSDYRAASPKMRAIMSRCVNEDLRNRFGGIKCPVLLIWGEEDTATPLRDAMLMEKLMPDAGLVKFPGAGHYSFLDNPFGFKAVMKEFFKSEFAKKE
ncbi:MAG: alpha/beta hydrolase [Muribaculaceae bacterium]|nr:alpha/beta hydrolase [Muribaculaceae bacterium]